MIIIVTVKLCGISALDIHLRSQINQKAQISALVLRLKVRTDRCENGIMIKDIGVVNFILHSRRLNVIRYDPKRSWCDVGVCMSDKLHAQLHYSITILEK